MPTTLGTAPTVVTSIRDWLTPVIALVALAQPWIISLWKRYFLTLSIEPIPTGPIQLMFGPDGPAIGLLGVLRCRHQSTIVKALRIKVIRFDHAELDLDAFAQRIQNDNGTERQAFPVAFRIGPDKLELYNIIFGERDTKELMQNLFRQLGTLWQPHLAQLSVTAAAGPVAPLPGTVAPLPGTVPLPVNPQLLVNKYNQALDAFSKTPATQAEFQPLIHKQNFWVRGDYQLTLYIDVQDRSEPFSQTWEFKIADDRLAPLREANKSAFLFSCPPPPQLQNTVRWPQATFDYVVKNTRAASKAK
jgi:hypothetical protein